jgi:hypothetical protein
MSFLSHNDVSERTACIEDLIEVYEAWDKLEKAEEWRAKLPRTEGGEEE